MTKTQTTDSFKKRSLFFIAGILFAMLLSTTSITGIWAIAAGIIAFILFGEAYLYATKDRQASG